MIQKKICMLGAFAVGKTSLVARYVHSVFSEDYQTTIGVKIDRKQVNVGEQEINLILWDLYGDDDFQSVRASYLRGAAGYLLVCDGTRRLTFDHALLLQKSIEEQLGPVPFVLLCNKFDLTQEWELVEDDGERVRQRDWNLMHTSAKTGEKVDDAFELLAHEILKAGS